MMKKQLLGKVFQAKSKKCVLLKIKTREGTEEIVGMLSWAYLDKLRKGDIHEFDVYRAIAENKGVGG